MQSKPEKTSGTWAGLGILAAGIAIGVLARPERWFEPRGSASERAPFPALVPAEPPETPPENGLETLELIIPASSAAVLERVRKDALERGIITQADTDTVSAEAVFDGAHHPVKLRLKGDWIDHVESEKWSYRIRLEEGAFHGMREFSIQTPKTRGFLWEWLVHEAARRENVLVPRSTFLNVVQNGHAQGVFFLEEHWEKELLESQGRREGPIVVWDESALWSALLQEGNVPSKGVRAFESRIGEPAHGVAAAEIRAYGEKRLSSIDGLNDSLFAALDQMKLLRAMAVAQQPEGARWRALEAMRDLRASTLEEVVEVERLGCAHALASVFQIEHSLAWHNMRFYRDPVLARLEPILFDNGAQEPSARDPVPFRANDLAAAFAHSPGYYQALFAHLGRMLRPDWLDGLFAAVTPQLAVFEAALLADGGLPPGCSVGEMKQRLRSQVLYLRKACLPADAVQFECEYVLEDVSRSAGQGWLQVRAWATTRSPVRLDGFRFSNGSFSPAVGALASGSPGATLRGRGVVLPVDGTAAVFRFPMDERLANLESVQKITRAFRKELTQGEALDLDVHAAYGLISSDEAHEEKLLFRRSPPTPRGEGRPTPPALGEALERHAFLRYDFTKGELFGLAGTWDVDGDLILPAGITLALVPGTTLRFRAGAVLLTDAPLRFVGTLKEPVVLEPQPGATSWQGVAVLGASGRSEWTEVTARQTEAVARGGWILTGGVTFYRSPVTLTNCRFEGTRAEDGLNVFGADIAFDTVTFSGCLSDSFDGDFVTGSLNNCTFENGLADGIDVSGSDIVATGCRFLNMGDKAYSVGERSRVRIEGGEAIDVAIGVASKDDSEVDIQGLTIQARHYALAAFVKKPEYGPARMSARGLNVRGAGLGVAIAQSGCRIELDGQVVPTQEIDVEASYEEGILGHAK